MTTQTWSDIIDYNFHKVSQVHGICPLNKICKDQSCGENYKRFAGSGLNLESLLFVCFDCLQSIYSYLPKVHYILSSLHQTFSFVQFQFLNNFFSNTRLVEINVFLFGFSLFTPSSVTKFFGPL